ncbi:hypothetical protein [Bosea sp. PAMC 26642]|uniref:hypothetical protein n=1 Tax=Bosea sp. (strain PAMC 26642) TaxID=1792307 RepID=UPI000770276B|nr:hypothetical protein [Bosea sp. PAMC 26642]AMJ61595.1 hypothetical protein AXW83_15925 [Bosea sp. PAMC 26642]
MSIKLPTKPPVTPDQKTMVPPPSTSQILEKAGSNIRVKIIALVLENKGGTGKSRIAEICTYTLSNGEDPSKKILVGETDSANRTQKMVGASEFIDLSEVQWTGQLEYIGERVASGEFDHAVIDCGARDETAIRAFLPEYGDYLASMGIRLVVIRPLTLSTFVQNNAYRFVSRVKTSNIGVVAVRNLSQGRTLAMFAGWIAKKARAEMLAKGVIEIDMQDAGARWSDEAVGYGLSFADIAFGRFSKIKDAEDRQDAIGIFDRPVQLFIASWLRKQSSSFNTALQAASEGP